MQRPSDISTLGIAWGCYFEEWSVSQVPDKLCVWSDLLSSAASQCVLLSRYCVDKFTLADRHTPLKETTVTQ